MGRRNFKNGFTLAEVIVAVGVLGVIISLALVAIKPRLQLAKVRDTRRKTDLKKIATALEDYLGDHPCYPAPEIMTCNPGDGLRPYLNKIPCDPLTGESYPYVRPDDCSLFVLYATMELEQPFDYGAGNYAITSPNLRLVPTYLPTPTPAPPTGGPTFEAAYYGCFSGVCQSIPGPVCQPNYVSNDCYNQCGTPENPRNECR